ncbi:hypothetical protein [Chamaesiphon sp. VAR_69_metabat_338]|uniref:hypothetical protein n=1 Tax=Chamaesiphon sp. VAR_69_metabat_338 TaxID=2964704 RepID=UPI00286DF2F4|nr:hypothetical protein [Chamaesiphon sp. VAR_69_metabat_338]
MSVDEIAIGQPDNIVSMHTFALNSSIYVEKYRDRTSAAAIHHYCLIYRADR